MPTLKDLLTQKPVYIGSENHAELKKAQTYAAERAWVNVKFRNMVLDMGEVLKVLFELDREMGGGK